MSRNEMILHIIALASHGSGISGGDRIWIEMSRRWCKKLSITIHTWQEGIEMANRQNLNKTKNLEFITYGLGVFCRLGFLICYIARVAKGLYLGLTIEIENRENVYIYNASEFWMDALPCAILKIRFPKVKWIASWYQTAPNPLSGFSEKGIGHRENKYFLNALLYWFVQFPIKPLIRKFADKVIVNNEDEKKQFPEHTKNGDSIVLIGAVPLSDIQKFLTTNYKLLTTRKYDAVFQGRFHPQKGVEELIEIWNKVIKKNPNAKLAMIGDGPLMEKVSAKIDRYELNKNITLYGYVFDGNKKYQIFSQSKLVVHPAFYDSGGMATAEAMAFGIPAVGFDLISYKSYYPEGMVKVPQNDLGAFANAILDLLSNDKKRIALGKKAEIMITKNYSWDQRANEILAKICS